LYINIDPETVITDTKVLIRPVAPGDLFVAEIRTWRIWNSISLVEINPDSDDRGLHYRLENHCSGDFLSYCDNIAARYLLFSCPGRQEEAPYCSNKFYVYDALSDASKPLNIHLVSNMCSMNEVDFVPYKVISQNKMDRLFKDEDDILFWGGSNLPRPLLIRAFDTVTADYAIRDRYLQWRPPRFWYQSELLDEIPRDTEGWIANILNSLNWAYFLHATDMLRSVDSEQLVASIFDLLYEDYLYYNICKRIWGDKASTIDPLTVKLLGGQPNQIMINYTDIIGRIRARLREEMIRYQIPMVTAEGEVEEHDSHTDLVDTSYAELYNTIFE